MSAVLTKTDPNPLLRIWREVHQSDEYRWLDRPFAPSRNSAAGFDSYTRRHDVVRTYAWSVPTDEALDAIAEFGPVVEIGAGTGYWAALLRQHGVEVAAYDIALPGSEDTNDWHAESEVFTEVWQGGTPMAGRWPDRTLLLSWPPYGSDMASRALLAYEDAGGRHVAYVGEGAGGCCADDAFFDRLGAGYAAGDETDQAAYEAAAPWREVRSVLLPQWSGINDWLTIYERQSR